MHIAGDRLAQLLAVLLRASSCQHRDHLLRRKYLPSLRLEVKSILRFKSNVRSDETVRPGNGNRYTAGTLESDLGPWHPGFCKCAQKLPLGTERGLVQRNPISWQRIRDASYLRFRSDRKVHCARVIDQPPKNLFSRAARKVVVIALVLVAPETAITGCFRATFTLAHAPKRRPEHLLKVLCHLKHMFCATRDGVEQRYRPAVLANGCK